MMNIKESIGFSLVKVLRLKRAFIDKKMKIVDLSRTQWRVLFWMNILGACSQKTLLEHLEIDAAHLTRVLDEFEKKSLIKRKSIPTDRRSLFVELTPSGKKKYIPFLTEMLAEENTILTKSFTAKEQKELIRLLKKMEDNMAEYFDKKRAAIDE